MMSLIAMLILWCPPLPAATAEPTPTPFPLVLVKISRVVAGFSDSHSLPTPREDIMSIEGSVMDSSDSMTLSQEMVLPGIIWSQQRPLVVVGLHWLWSDIQSNTINLEVFQPGGLTIPFKVVGVDERIGMLVAEPSDSGRHIPIHPLPIKISPRISGNKDLRLICFPGDRSLRLATTRRETGSGNHSTWSVPRYNLPPLLLPVFDSDGRFDGFGYTRSSARQGTGELVVIPRSDIATRVRYIANNGVNLTPGYLGVYLTERTRNTAPPQVTIRDVVPDSPSAVAGILPGDIVTRINNQQVLSARDLIHRLRQYTPNTRIRLDLVRRGQSLHQEVILGRPRERDSLVQSMAMEQMSRSTRYRVRPDRSTADITRRALAGDSPTMGIFMQTPHPALLQALGADGRTGVLVTYVLPGLPGYEAGLRAGDLIMSINGQAVTQSGDIHSLLKKMRKGQKIEVQFYRRGSTKVIQVQLK